MRPGVSTRTRLAMIGAGSVCLLLLLIITAWIMAGWSPGWFDPLAEDDGPGGQLGEQVEFRLAEELQKIRPPGNIWRLRITDDAINAWLSTRMRPWMSHQPDVTWPESLSRPQVRFRPNGIDVGIRVEDLYGEDRLVILTFHPSIDDSRIRLQPQGVSLGMLPIPFGLAAAEAQIRQSLPELEGLAGSLINAALGDETMEALIPLVDDRRVQLKRIELDRGAVILEASTLPSAPS